MDFASSLKYGGNFIPENGTMTLLWSIAIGCFIMLLLNLGHFAATLLATNSKLFRTVNAEDRIVMDPVSISPGTKAQSTASSPVKEYTDTTKAEPGQSEDDTDGVVSDGNYTSKSENNWRCACEGGFLPPGMLKSFGGAEAMMRFGAGQCYQHR